MVQDNIKFSILSYQIQFLVFSMCNACFHLAKIVNILHVLSFDWKKKLL
jgi:hypothetical protein